MAKVRRVTKTIPNISSRNLSLEMNDYSAGMNSYVSNDKFPVRDGGTNQWRLAQNARITTLGEYDTRKGLDFHSSAVGSTLDASQVSITAATDQEFNETTWLAQPFTTAASGRLTRLDVNLKNDAGATGTVMIELWSDDGGAPGEMLSCSSIASSDIDSSYAYESARYVEAPALSAATMYWIVARVQAVGTGSYKWSATTNDTTALTSGDAGTSWITASAALNFRQYYATDAAPKGLFRGYKSDGTAITLIAHGTSLYSVNEVTGALTAIKTGLSGSATHYRFALVNDIIYYVNGQDGLRKWDFTTESQVNATNYTHVTVHKGMLFLVSRDDPNKLVFSNFAAYETFTSTDFIYVPAPKTGDPIAALVSLNGYLIIPTLKSKYILSGDDNATFSLEEAPDQNGTFTQETVTKDDNFIYYLSGTGVYRSNGSEPQLLTENIYEDVRRIANKETGVLAINKGRLYYWYASDGVSYNDRCYVWNLNYGTGGSDSIESHDSDAYVSRAVTAFRDDDDMLVASSVIGQVYWQERESNDYHNLGCTIKYELETHYHTAGSPAAKKQLRDWWPRFAAQSNNYDILCQYAYDQRNNWQTLAALNVQGTGSIWGAFTWGSSTWGTAAEINPPHLCVPGDYQRIAVRYKHHAARQPHRFLGHSLTFQVRRRR